MPRPKNNSLLALFKCNEFNQIVCYNGKCDGRLLYKHSANLERHLQKLHPHVFASYIKKKKIFKFPRKLNFEKRLIDLMRVYPILWDKAVDGHLDDNLTNKAWEDISYKMEVTVDTCKLKWDNLIDRFRSELIQFPQLTPETCTNNNKDKTTNSKSSWKYFSELHFMRDQIDLTKIPTHVQLQSMENMKTDYIKEESSESYLLYNDTVEESSMIDYREESMTQHEREEYRAQHITDQIQDSRVRRQDEREASESPEEHRDELIYRFQNKTTSSMKKSKRRPSLEQTDSEDDCEYFYGKPKKMKRKKIRQTMGTENNDCNSSDTDRMFLLSLLPFLQKISDKKKLLVRHRLQGVLLEEQNS